PSKVEAPAIIAITSGVEYGLNSRIRALQGRVVAVHEGWKLLRRILLSGRVPPQLPHRAHVPRFVGVLRFAGRKGQLESRAITENTSRCLVAACCAARY